MSFQAFLRQLRHPGEFRIAPSSGPAYIQSLLQSLIQSRTTEADRQLPQVEIARLLADVGTGMWRMRKKMLQPGADRSLEEMRRAYRHLESAWDALAQAGVQVRDHTGEPFHAGRAIKVVAYQPTPGMPQEEIVETIKPSIYFGDTPIQMGEVIVATPEPADVPQRIDGG